MSGEDDISTTDGEEEEVLYQCSRCADGKSYTAEERDAHRLWHRAEKEKNKSKKMPARQNRWV